MYNIVVVFAIHWHESAMGGWFMSSLPPPTIQLPPPSLSHPSGSSQCTSPEHPVSCIKPGLVIYFTYDNIHVSMLFSQIIPPLFFPDRVQKSILYICVSFAVSHIGSSLLFFWSILAWRIPMDRGVWPTTVHGVTKRQTWLSDFHM